MVATPVELASQYLEGLMFVDCRPKDHLEEVALESVQEIPE